MITVSSFIQLKSALLGRTPGSFSASKAYNLAAVITNIRNQGRCKYLLRDGEFEISPFGRGQYPNSGCAALTFYVRQEGFTDARGEYPYGDGTQNARNGFTDTLKTVWP